MMRSLRPLAALAILLAAAPAHGEDVWVLEGSAATLLPACEIVAWRPGAVAHNRGAAAATIRPLHVSNGGVPAPVTVVPAGSSAVIAGGTADASAWITRLDVPPGVAIEARMELYSSSCLTLGLPPALVPFSKLRMPVFRRLAPAGEEQLHYGTDLGGNETRQNVGIYNAGAAAANATIRVVQPFCGKTYLQTALIAPDTFTQIVLPRIELCSQNSLHTSSAYTVVTIDQPGLSIVSTLRNGVMPGATTAVSE